LLAIFAPASSASGGAIEAAQVDASLAFVSVQDLSVAYDACPAAEPDCSWQATALLVPPNRAPCPPHWSWLLETSENPPGMPPPPPGTPTPLHTGKVWFAESKGNAALHSGSLRLPLGGVNDYYLCLYAQHFYSPSIYVPHLPDESDLVASQLLHVDLPAQTPPPATTPVKRSPKKRCRKGKRRVRVEGRLKCRRIKR
jgi:hypothetical protein